MTDRPHSGFKEPGHVPVAEHECKEAVYLFPTWWTFCPVCGDRL